MVEWGKYRPYTTLEKQKNRETKIYVQLNF